LHLQLYGVYVYRLAYYGRRWLLVVDPTWPIMSPSSTNTLVDYNWCKLLKV